MYNFTSHLHLSKEWLSQIERFGQLLNRARAWDPSLANLIEDYWTLKKGAQADRPLNRNRKRDFVSGGKGEPAALKLSIRRAKLGYAPRIIT